MVNPTNIAIKFTDEVYATPAQVGKSLHMVVYDDFWKQIITYREQHKYTLPFGKIKGQLYFITLTEPIRIKIANFESKIKDFLNLSRSMLLTNGKETRSILFTPLLKEAASLEKSTINDLSIKMLLNSLYQENDSNHTAIVNYLSALDYYLDQSPAYPDEDFLAGAYQKTLGQEELVDFYREKDFDNRVSHLAYIRDPDYPYAPSDLIEELMSTFMEWLNNSENGVPSFVRAYLAFHYLNYVKPFMQRNSLVASLLAKETIASSIGISEAFALPFELLLRDSFLNSEAYRESKTRCDLTYAIFEAINVMTPYIDNVTNQLKELRISQYKKEYSYLSEEEEKIANKTVDEPVSEPTQLSFLDDHEEVKEEQKEEIEEIKEEIPEPQIEEIKEVEVEKPAPEVKIIEEKPIEKPQVKVITQLKDEQHQPKEIEEGLSKAERKDYIRYLLETNPNLNKKQATFLANHNTQGRYYTIQQYKEFASCVYETARTSMDKLAQEGYYEKLQFKNKFVYSPVKKGK